MSIEILWWWMWSKIISKGRRVVMCHLQKPDLFHCPNFLHNCELIYFYLFVWFISLKKKKKTIITFITLVVIFFFVFVTSTVTDIRLATIPIITLSLWQYVPQPLWHRIGDQHLWQLRQHHCQSKPWQPPFHHFQLLRREGCDIVCLVDLPRRPKNHIIDDRY